MSNLISLLFKNRSEEFHKAIHYYDTTAILSLIDIQLCEISLDNNLPPLSPRTASGRHPVDEARAARFPDDYKSTRVAAPRCVVAEHRQTGENRSGRDIVARVLVAVRDIKEYLA